MCVNYERQLQKVEGEKQKYHNLANNLQIELEQEKVCEMKSQFVFTNYDLEVKWVLPSIRLQCLKQKFGDSIGCDNVYLMIVMICL